MARGYQSRRLESQERHPDSPIFLTDSLVMIFKGTRNRTELIDHEFLTNSNILHGACYVECERSLCMYVRMYDVLVPPYVHLLCAEADFA